jgi:tetratricopeptide (TPR) repeat protein
MGNRKGAVKEFREEVRANPNSLEAMTTLGAELTEAGENDEAVAVLQKAMNLYPLSAKAKEEAGWAQYKAKNLSAGMALLQAATQLDRGNPSAYRKLGLIYRETGDLLNMKAFLQKYLDLAPDAPDRETVEGYIQQAGSAPNPENGG